MSGTTEPRVAQRRDYREHTIEHLFDELEAAKALIASLQSDIEVYRTIAFAAVARAGELRRDNEMLSARAYVHRQRTAEQRPEEIRRRQEAA